MSVWARQARADILPGDPARLRWHRLSILTSGACLQAPSGFGNRTLVWPVKLALEPIIPGALDPGLRLAEPIEFSRWVYSPDPPAQGLCQGAKRRGQGHWLTPSPPDALGTQAQTQLPGGLSTHCLPRVLPICPAHPNASWQGAGPHGGLQQRVRLRAGSAVLRIRRAAALTAEPCSG